MGKVLFFFTAKYPFGKGDSFIENEMPYLAKSFEKIVVISNECNDAQTKPLPSNAIVARLPYNLEKIDTILSIFGIFSSLFWKEMSCIKTIYKKKISILIIKTALISLRKSKVFGKSISQIIANNSSTDDKMYAYSYWANDMAFALSQLKDKYPSLKTITRAHGWDVYFEANKAHYLPFRKTIIEKLDNTFFISDCGLNYYKNYFPELEHKMGISRLGVTEQKSFKLVKSVTNKGLHIVSCSNVLPIKRVHLIAEALLKITDFQIHWIHFGDGSLLNELQEKCGQLLSKKENILFSLAGHVSNNEVIKYLANQNVDFLINVSSTEGIPVSIMEAMSLGIPAIATNVGGTSEIVDNGKNGFLLSPNPSTDEIAEMITKYYRLSDFAKNELCENAFKTWESKYNSETNFTTFINQIM